MQQTNHERLLSSEHSCCCSWIVNVAECSPADPEKLNGFHNWADFNDRQISQIMKCMYSRMSHMIVAVVFLFIIIMIMIQ